jgi:methylmalonyl-CoA mutase C-terminal domain/subunit
MKILVAKPGLDGHDRGAKVVAQALRDAGVEVVYSGLRRTPEEIVQEAIQEDVDVIGLSVLSGAHVPLARRVLEGLRAQGAGDIRVVVGGIIPPRDVPALQALGVARIFPMGTPLPAIVAAFKEGSPP